MKEEWEVSILLALFFCYFAGIIHHRGKEDTEVKSMKRYKMVIHNNSVSSFPLW